MTLLNNFLATELDKKDIGVRLKQARTKAGLSQGEMAKQLGYRSAASVSNKEAGLSYPSVIDVHYLSFYSGLSIDWIVTGSDNKIRGKDPLATPEVLTAEEGELIRQYRSMNDKMKARLAFSLMRMKHEPDELEG